MQTDAGYHLYLDIDDEEVRIDLNGLVADVSGIFNLLHSNSEDAIKAEKEVRNGRKLNNHNGEGVSGVRGSELMEI
jgi:hypothetical protein